MEIEREIFKEQAPTEKIGQNLLEDLENETVSDCIEMDGDETREVENKDNANETPSTPLAMLVSLAATMSMKQALNKYPELAK